MLLRPHAVRGGPDANSSAAHLLRKSDSEDTPADSGSEVPIL